MITKNNLDKESRRQIFGIQQMSLAMAGWPKEEWQKIDERMLFLTIHVPHKDDIPNLVGLVYTKIRKSLGFADSNAKIAMIAGADIGGTRNHAVGLADDSLPHIHAIVILPTNLVCKQNEGSWSSIKEGIKSSILEIRETRNLKIDKPVYVEKMSFDDQNVFNSIDYILKAGKNYTDDVGSAPAYFIFPFEQLRQHQKAKCECKKLRLSMHFARSNVFQYPKNQDSMVFEDDVRAAYFDAANDQEKRLIYRRLCHLIN